METTTLFRPVGQLELDLIAESGWSAFPPRLDWQPIFYPVTNEHYATRIASEWNTGDEENGHVGYVLRFEVQSEFLALFDVQQVGDETCLEYWIPAERLDEFNAAIAGRIEQVGFHSKWDELPVLFLDIDGVFNPLGVSSPPGFRTDYVDGFEVAISEAHATWLASLRGRAQLVWATTWEYSANRSMGPALGLPQLPVLEFNEGREGDTWKLPAVREWVGDRPMVWVDDELYSDAFAWAEARPSRTLLVRPSAYAGLSSGEIAAIDRFLDEARSGMASDE
ncbi:MAG: HAD domain-containing protein [Actinomycetota bacterium]